MEMETKSIIQISLNNNREMIVNVDYGTFQTLEDTESIYTMLGAMEKIKSQLLDVLYEIEDGDEEQSDKEEDPLY